ncbi:MAG: class I SAM-dependent methyltransferase, partial [Cyanobacteria bacterium J06633_2]
PSPVYFLDLALFGRRELRSIFQMPETGETVVVTKNREYDAANQIYKVNLYFRFSSQPDELYEEHYMRLFFPQELEALLRHNNFVVREKFGNYAWEKYTSDSVKQIVICNKIN